MTVAGRMTRFKLNEISAVDRPAQEHAKAVIFKRAEPNGDGPMFDPVIKRDFSDKKRKELADTGKALPDGSFPIETEADLHNAVSSVGRAKNEAKAKAHIIARANAMGMNGALPDGWVSKAANGQTGDEMNVEIRKALGLPDTATDAEVTAAVVKVASAESQAGAAALAKANEELATTQRQLRKASMTADEKDHTSSMSDDATDAFMQKPADERKKIMSKAAEGDEILEIDGKQVKKSAVGGGVFELLKSQSDQLKANTAAIEKANEIAANATFAKRAVDEFSHVAGTVEERVQMLKGIALVAKSDPVAAKAMETAMAAAEGAGKFAFSRVGTGGGLAPAGGDGADAQIDKAVADYMTKNPSVTKAKATDAVLQANPDLYEKSRVEKRERAKAA